MIYVGESELIDVYESRKTVRLRDKVSRVRNERGAELMRL